MRLRTRVGSYCWVLARGLAVRGPDRVAYRMAGSLTDITERVQSTQQLEHDAFHDSLTGLPNRALLLDRLSQAMERAHRNSQYHYAVLFMDLDGFKAVNDHLGHAAGDRLLIEIARRLKQTLRSCDTLARLGGDEFVALIEETNGPADGTIVAERFLEQFQAPFELDGKPMCTSASIGIVAGSGQYEGAEKILRDADVAMYQAKSAGKARFELFSGSFSAGLTA
jgi:diguanylate cyclase (GGDEF)-like protein